MMHAGHSQLAALLSIALAAGAAHAQATTREPPPPVAIKPIAPPKDLAGVDALRRQVEGALAEARAATQPSTTQPTADEKRQVDAAAELVRVLSDYSEVLERYAAELRTIEDLGAPATLQRQAVEIERLRERDQAVQARLEAPLPASTERQRTQAQSEYTELAARQEALAAWQTLREKRAADWEADQRQAQADTAAALDALSKTGQAAGTQPGAPSLTEPILVWRAALAQLREELLRAERIRLEQAQKADAAVLPVLSSLAAHLGDWVGKLHGAAADLESQMIEREFARAGNGVERLYWQARRDIIREILRFSEVNNSLRTRFPVAKAEELSRRVAREQTAWGRWMEAIKRASGPARLRRYDEVLESIRRTRRQLGGQLRPMLDLSFAELERLASWRDAFHTEQEALSASFEDTTLVAPARDELLRAATALADEAARFLVGASDDEGLRSALDAFSATLARTLPEASATRIELQTRLDGIANACGVSATPPDAAGRSGEPSRSERAARRHHAVSRSDIQDRLDVLASAVRGLPDSQTANQARLLQSELIGKQYPRAEDVISKTIASEDQLIARQEGAIALLSGYLDALDRWRDALYWSRLLVRDNGWFALDFRRLTQELAGLAPPGLGPLHAVRDEFVAELGRAPLEYWLAGVILLVLCGGAGATVRRRLWARRARLELEALDAAARDERPELPLSTRLTVQATGWLATLSLWGAPLVALTVSARFLLRLEGAPRRLALHALAYICLYLLVLSTWVRLFEAGKTRFRLLTCSNIVATHYRRWGRVVLTLAALSLAGPGLAWELDVLPATRAFALELCKSLVLILLLLFALRRDLVLKVVGRDTAGRFRRTYAAVVSLYPFGWLALLALLVLQILGYGALTRYVVSGVSVSIVVSVVALLLARLVREQTQRMRRRVAADNSAGAAQIPGPTVEDEFQALLGGTAAGEWSVLLATGGAVLRWAVVFAALLAIGATWGLSRRQLTEWLNTSLWGDAKTGADVTAGRLVLALVSVIAAILASRAARRVLHMRVYPRHSGIDRGAQAAIDTLLHYTVVLIGLYVGLRAVRLDFGALVVLFGGLGLGLGLGLQPLIVNFVSGLLILFERHVRVGDVIMVNNELGEVTQLNMRSTTVRTYDGIDMVVPNGEFINKAVVNWTRGGIIRGQINVGIKFGGDPNEVREILLGVARKHPKVLSTPPPAVWLKDFNASALNFTLACWFANPEQRWQGSLDIRYQITEEFRAKGIEIP